MVPSLWKETGPMVVIDALAYGIPIIGSKIGGIKELISGRLRELLFEPGNIRELTEKLKQFLNHKDRYIQKPVKIETFQSHIDKLLVLYTELLKKSKTKGD